MICRTCGTEIAGKALICYRCGTATTEPIFKPPPLRSSQPSMLGLVIGILAGAIVALGAASAGLRWAGVEMRLSPIVLGVLTATMLLFGVLVRAVVRRRRR